MSSDSVIVSIKDMNDIRNITENTKYINICIDSVGTDVIDYFLLNGMNYSYTDTINDRSGFIYASYDMFKSAESIIDSIVYNMPNDLTDLEKIRYVYIYLGKFLCCDINSIDDKNEVVSFGNISVINNIWGSLSSGLTGDVVTSKIFMYVCSRIGIKCEVVNSNIKGNFANKVYFDDDFIVVDLFDDLFNIHGGFCTCYFDKYNDNKDIDRKIKYINDEYMNYYIDNIFKEIDYKKSDSLYNILTLTSNVMNIGCIGVFELYKIYKLYFDKYVVSYDIKINNLYINGELGDRKHFVLFSYNDVYYSFNYNKRCFVEIEYNILYDNIKNNRIGIYDFEQFELKEKSVVL